MKGTRKKVINESFVKLIKKEIAHVQTAYAASPYRPTCNSDYVLTCHCKDL